MKVVLATLNAKYIHSSLALRYLQKYCGGSDSGNHELEIYLKEYTINDQMDSITADLYKMGADIVAFACYIWNIGMILEIADRMKKVSPACRIILGGPEVSYDAKDILEKYSFVDYIVIGEGEETLKELLHHLSDTSTSETFKTIEGIAYRNEQGDIMVNRSRPLIEDLDRIPSPYQTKDLENLDGKIIYYETTRGCPFNCSYCLSSTIPGVRYFSIERVKKDLMFLIENNVKLVKFVDRTFNCNRERAMEIFKFLVEHRKNTLFHFEVAADLLDEEMVCYLSHVPAGLFQLEIGVQSTNLNTVAAIQRKMNLEKVENNVRKLRQSGNIHLHLDLIAGLPGEDYGSFEKSFNDVFGLRPHALQLGFLKLLKGSGIRKQAAQYGYKSISVPPYEVLENRWMPYEDLLRLKAVEDVLDKYCNSGVFEKSLSFIINSFYTSPFRFFEDVAAYFENKGLTKVSHSRKALYDILFEFYKDIIGRSVEVFTEYLKFDLIFHQKGARMPYWANGDSLMTFAFKERCFDFLKNNENIEKYLPQRIGVPAKKIIKEVEFASFNVNIFSGRQVDQGPAIVLFDYSVPQAYDITKDF